MNSILIAILLGCFPLHQTELPQAQSNSLRPDPAQQSSLESGHVLPPLRAQSPTSDSASDQAVQHAGANEQDDVAEQNGAVRQAIARQQIEVPDPDTLVFCPPVFFDALKPWIAHREQQGHAILAVAPPGGAPEIKQKIVDIASGGTLKYVVLIGDCGDANYDDSQLVATDFVEAEVNVHFGSEREIATDNTFADLNDDGSPDLAIGRLPVDTPQELTTLVDRIIRYESKESCGQWQKRVNLIAGVGGFGEFVDRMIEQTTRQIVTDLIPPGFDASMTYGSWMSPYCPDPRRMSETVVGRFNEGCVFWVYIGHGNRRQLDKIYLPDQSHRILDMDSVKQLSCTEGSPIALFLACYTGAADGPEDCIAEEMLRQEQGPIAVISGTRITMPYAMSLLSLEMLREYFGGTVPTLGELVLVGKQRMVAESESDDPYRTMIDGLGKAMSPLPELLVKERVEHGHLINLLGDPLLRLKRCEELVISAPESAAAGELVEVSGNMPADGVLHVDISYQRDRFRFRPPRRKEYDSSDESFEKYQTAYEQAHQLVCFEEEITSAEGPFNRSIQVPEDATGKCHIRAVLITDEEAVVGSAPITITPMVVKDREETPEKSPVESSGAGG